MEARHIESGAPPAQVAVNGPTSRVTQPATSLGPQGAGGAHDDANEDFLFHLYRGSELLQDNRAEEAQEELERALRLQPHDAKGQDLLAVVYFRLGQYARALSIYEQLRQANPRDPALLLNLALCYLKSGEPAFARRDLELLITANPKHARAWGYLGLACERLGAFADAQHAFEQGGHEPMARRVKARRDSETVSSAAADARGTSEFEELDEGERTFDLALHLAPALRRDYARDAPAAVLPRIGPSAGTPQHRPTLMVGVAPHHEGVGFEALNRMPSHRAPPPFSSEPANPSALVPAAARAPKTLPPPPVWRASAVPPAARTPSVGPPSPSPKLVFPPPGGVTLHPSGVALVCVATATDAGFVARLEALRAASSSLSVQRLERQLNGQSTGESLGGLSSPLVSITGDGSLVLAPRPGRSLILWPLVADTLFVRESLVFGFDRKLTFENGRLATDAEGEFAAVVQLRGTGIVLLDLVRECLTLEVSAARSLRVRKDAVVGWYGRLVPRALGPSEAPCGQRGLLSFSGEGGVLVASA